MLPNDLDELTDIVSSRSPYTTRFPSCCSRNTAVLGKGVLTEMIVTFTLEVVFVNASSRLSALQVNLPAPLQDRSNTPGAGHSKYAMAESTLSVRFISVKKSVRFISVQKNFWISCEASAFRKEPPGRNHSSEQHFSFSFLVCDVIGAATEGKKKVAHKKICFFLSTRGGFARVCGAHDDIVGGAIGCRSVSDTQEDAGRRQQHSMLERLAHMRLPDFPRSSDRVRQESRKGGTQSFETRVCDVRRERCSATTTTLLPTKDHKGRR